MYRLIFTITFLIFSQQSFAASPWMLSEGEYYYSGGLNYSTGDRSWDSSSHLKNSSCRSKKLSSNQHLEYGYSYYHTLIASTEIIDKDCGDNDYSGFGDLRLGIRGRLDMFSNGKTWELTAIIPTGYSKKNRSRPGNGEVGIEGGLAYLSRGEERDFAPRWDFLTGASLRYWFNGPADQFLTYATVRRHIGKSGRISFGISADISFQNEDDVKNNSFADETQLSDYDKVQVKISWANKLNDDWRYKVGASHVVWGRNSGHDLKVGITFSRHWGP